MCPLSFIISVYFLSSYLRYTSHHPIHPSHLYHHGATSVFAVLFIMCPKPRLFHFQTQMKEIFELHLTLNTNYVSVLIVMLRIIFEMLSLLCCSFVTLLLCSFVSLFICSFVSLFLVTLYPRCDLQN